MTPEPLVAPNQPIRKNSVDQHVLVENRGTGIEKLENHSGDNSNVAEAIKLTKPTGDSKTRETMAII